MTTNVEIMKTKAEKAFAEHFASVSGSLPSDAVALDARQAAMSRFDELGLPHRRIESWKYTDLRNALTVDVPAVGDATAVSAADLDAALGPLAGLDTYRAVFVNGRLDEGLSTLPSMTGVEIGSSSGAPAMDDALAAESIVALNTAFVTGGLAIKIADGVAVDKPLMIVSARAGGSDLLVTTRHDVSVGTKASLTLIEAFASIGGTAGQSNALVTITIADGGRLDHTKVGATVAISDLATWRAHLGNEATYRAFQLIPGAPLARNQVFVTFDGEGSALDFATAAMGNGKDHIDSTIVVDHRAVGCTSRELFKGVLDDSARGVCQGKVIVQQIAQKTDGKQMAQALMLSEDCEFDSKPELEIYADDVVCGHGSTSAEVDPDLVFNCRSRGIPEAEAKVLLTESFVAETIDHVSSESLRDALSEIARNWLAANHTK
ncbi:MAG: Fe-S cluster assembly protein SufD [Hyphomicrobiaceae bacterium]|jgi:Fe-S cluster assembly protein SufD